MKGAIVFALFAILATAYCYTEEEIEAEVTKSCLQHGDGYLVADVADCSKFYECVGSEGVHFKMECNEGLVYNGNMKACDYPETTVCSTQY